MPTITPVDRPDWLPATVWPFAIRTLDAGGTPLAYCDTGDGPTLLFVHAGLWSFVWRDLMLALRPHFRCVTFDPPGSGLSGRVPPSRQSLAAVRDATGMLLDHLDLRAVTLVVHDLGGVAALAALADRPGRCTGLAAVNTFGWRPDGPLFRGMLALAGSGWLRRLDRWTGLLPAAAGTRVGVGARLDRPGRRAFRRGLDRAALETTHRLFASARRSPEVYRAAALAVERVVADGTPVLTVFGAWSDYLGLQAGWRQRCPGVEQVTAGRFHFPMMDDADAVAAALVRWHSRSVAAAPGEDPPPVAEDLSCGG